MTDERGSVSAELAVTLPAVVAVLGLVLGGLGLVTDRAWLTSASGWAARAIAIGGNPDVVVADVLVGHADVAPNVLVTDEMVCVSLALRPNGPFGALGLGASGSSCVRRVL